MAIKSFMTAAELIELMKAEGLSISDVLMELAAQCQDKDLTALYRAYVLAEGDIEHAAGIEGERVARAQQSAKAGA